MGGWLASNHPVRAIETTRDEAERLGAMALFGEKYGERVRMVEIEGVSRELCGGTHVRSTSEIGLFHVTTETSSASNVRRIEAVTGPEAARLFQERTRMLEEIASLLKVPEQEVVKAVDRLSARVKELERKPKAARRRRTPKRSRTEAEDVSGVRVLVKAIPDTDPSSLRDISDTVRQKLGDAVVMLGSATDGRVHLVANVAPSVVERGVKAADLVKVGGADRGRRRRRPRHARAGRREGPGEAGRGARDGEGRDREGARVMRVLALDHGSARCGAAISDPTGTLATPLAAWSGRTRREGSRRSRGWSRRRAPSGSWSGFR